MHSTLLGSGAHLSETGRWPVPPKGEREGGPGGARRALSWRSPGCGRPSGHRVL